MKYYPPSTEEMKIMKRHHLDNDLNEFNHAVSLLNQKVQKKSKRPFKSTLTVNTVRGILRNKNTGRWAVLFVEDQSCVDAHVVRIADVKSTD